MLIWISIRVQVIFIVEDHVFNLNSRRMRSICTVRPTGLGVLVNLFEVTLKVGYGCKIDEQLMAVSSE